MFECSEGSMLGDGGGYSACARALAAVPSTHSMMVGPLVVFYVRGVWCGSRVNS